MQQRKESRPNPTEFLSIVLVATTVALIWWVLGLLDYADRRFVIVGGLSGGVASSIAMLVRIGGQATVQEVVKRHGLVAVFVPTISGLAAGGFSVLSVIALFSIGKQSPAGAAVFGGLYGLLLGGWTNAILRASSASEQRTIVAAALEQVGREARSFESHKYNGRVHVRFEPSRAEGRVIGNLSVMFAATERPYAGPDKNSWVAGPVRIDEGVATDVVPFDLGIIPPSGFAAYPRVRSLEVPAADTSDVYAFTVVRDSSVEYDEPTELVAEADQATPTSEWSPAGKANAVHGRVPTIVIDISQSSRTVQLLEIPLTGSHAEATGERSEAAGTAQSN